MRILTRLRVPQHQTGYLSISAIRCKQLIEHPCTQTWQKGGSTSLVYFQSSHNAWVAAVEVPETRYTEETRPRFASTSLILLGRPPVVCLSFRIRHSRRQIWNTVTVIHDHGEGVSCLGSEKEGYIYQPGSRVTIHRKSGFASG